MRLSSIIFLFLFLLPLQNRIYAQVGIGTTTPDATSILDIESTTQGVLAPRMTSAQRNAIGLPGTPAEGLLVYDTDEAAFYYYDNSIWSKLQNQIRDNYKLVNNITDLAPELALGGGSQYLLQSNYLYEINGTIVVDFPIELNGAYVTGEDGLEDVLFNASGGTLFVGNTGGNLKRLNVFGNSQQIFDIDGGGTQNLVTNAVNYIGSSSLGSLNNMGLVFFNTGQFINNTTGLTVANANSFFMTSFTWKVTNSGTFLTLLGTFDEVQLSNARVNTDSGETGIDVSSNPIITGSASIAQVSFEGAGTLVNGYTVGTYTGYNFSNDWYIQSQGILQETDDNATGDIISGAAYGSGIFTNFTGTGSSSRSQISGATTSSNLFRFVISGNNRIVYDGIKTRYFSVNASISFRGYVNNDVFVFYIAKGNSGDATASVDVNTKVYREIGATNDIGAVAVIGAIELSPGDFIEVWAERLLGSGNLLVTSMNLIAQ